MAQKLAGLDPHILKAPWLSGCKHSSGCLQNQAIGNQCKEDPMPQSELRAGKGWVQGGFVCGPMHEGLHLLDAFHIQLPGCKGDLGFP